MALAASAFSMAAVAVMKTVEQVQVNDATSSANGDLGYSRSTADSVQYIGCYINGSGAGAATGICTARNAAGLTRNCTTTHEKWLTIIASLNGDSNLYFRWNTDGKCTMLIVKNYSTLMPK